ncbi:DegT/DnrJ/EryC1/StrS family aminotransferase [Ignavibacteria bacterium]|nr:DegT/DnrJ/EryC1/StrS family aminotransferase [Bacteroidota bacterium]MCZ2132638.1 DegT/DnrJ/EryC1/StrS family aminotransferase [Bacteroidota bacterium]
MIPVFEPIIGDEEIALVTEALRRGEISGSFGKFIPEFEGKFAEYIGVRHAIAVTSGTTALHLAVRAAGIGTGDEVLVSASTNIATGLAAYHNGAVPVAVDSESETWNLDLGVLESLITSRSKAIIPVHLFGHPVDMDALMIIAQKYGLTVIEDCAESHGATVRGRTTGSFGDMNCFSFYANKIITTGEGGMICTNSDTYAEKLRLLRNLAFTKPRFWHQEAGFNFRMTGYQAAMGIAQLARIEELIALKRDVASRYSEQLSGVPGLQLPSELPWARNVYWMYGIVIGEEFGVPRDAVMQKLQECGIETRSFFCPMNIQPCFKDIKGRREISCPTAERLWRDGLYLPSSYNLTDEQISYICSCLRDISAAG